MLRKLLHFRFFPDLDKGGNFLTFLKRAVKTYSVILENKALE